MRFISLAAAFTLCAAPLLAAPVDPIALYQFDASDASDSSGNGNDGTLVGGVTFAAGQTGFGTAAEFTPTGGLSGINTGIDINATAFSALTMGAWVMADSAGAGVGGKILSHDNGSFDRTLGFDTRGDSAGTNMAAFTGSGVADIDGAYADFGAWVHFVVVYDSVGGTGSIFRNGILSETFTDSTGSDTSGFPLYIGTNPGFNEDFDGLLDDVFVYGRALSGTEILDIYENGFTAPVPLPAGLPLAAAGLGALAFLRTRRR